MHFSRLPPLGIFLFLFCSLVLQTKAQTLAIIQVGGGQIIATSISQARGTAIIIVNNEAFPLAIIDNQPLVIINGQAIIITVAQFVGSGGGIVVSSAEVVDFTSVRSGTGTEVTYLKRRWLSVGCDIDTARDSTVDALTKGYGGSTTVILTTSTVD